MTPETKKRRSLWRPKLRELKEQCASCPFRKGNDVEFGGIVKKLLAKGGVPMTEDFVPPPQAIQNSRRLIKADLKHSGDFACHHTAYDAEMNLKPDAERRQCPGASKWFKEGT